jgi:hypothetical protein
MVSCMTSLPFLQFLRRHFLGLYVENIEYDTTSKFYNLLVHPGWSVHWMKFSNDIGVDFPSVQWVSQAALWILRDLQAVPRGSIDSFL